MFGSNSSEKHPFGKLAEKNSELKVWPDSSRNRSLFEITQLYSSTVDPSGVSREVLPLPQISLLSCMREKLSVLTDYSTSYSI